MSTKVRSKRHNFVIMLGLLTVLFLANCASAKGSRVPAGGMHSGGENLYKGKPIESYIRDIKNMDGYIAYVEPILKNIKNSGAYTLYNFLNYTIENKIWFFLPGPLDSIPEETLGIAVNTEQGVLQSFNNVIVDSNYWDNHDKMTAKNQALLIIHELWMGMKIAQFGSSYLQCMHSNYQYPNNCLGDNDKNFKTINLTSSDYKQVQKLTQITFDDSNKLSKEDWLDLINFNNFEYQWYFFEQKDQEMEWIDFIKNIRIGKFTNNNPTFGYNMKNIDQLKISSYEEITKYFPEESCSLTTEELPDKINIHVNSESFHYTIDVTKKDKISFKKINITEKSDFLKGFSGNNFERFSLGKQIKSKIPDTPDKYMSVMMLTNHSGIAFVMIQEMTCVEPGDRCHNIDVKGGLHYACSRIKNPFGFK